MIIYMDVVVVGVDVAFDGVCVGCVQMLYILAL